MTVDVQEVRLSRPVSDPASATVVGEIGRVAPIVGRSDDTVQFRGDLVARVEPFTRPGRIEIYRCPEGWLLFCYDSAKDHWACSGDTLDSMLQRLEEESIAHLVEAGLQRSGHLAPPPAGRLRSHRFDGDAGGSGSP